MFRKHTHTGVGAFVLIFATLLLAGRERLLRDPGTFWHVVVGQQILDSGRLPVTDTLTFTHAGSRWIAQQWLAECAMAGLHRIGGLDTVVVAAATLLAGVFAGAHARLRDAGLSWQLAMLATALAIGASSYHFHARPHLATIALSAWLYAVILDVDAGRRPMRALLLRLPVLIVWANLHGGALGGVATLALACIGWVLVPPLPSNDETSHAPMLPQLRNPNSNRRRRIGLAAVIMAAAALTPFAGPYGSSLLRVWLGLLRSSVLPRVIIEHAPPDFHAPETWMLAALLLVYLAVIAGARGRIRLTWLLPLAWAALAATRIRHGPIFAVMAVFAIAEFLPHSRWGRWFAGRGSDLMIDLPPISAPRPRWPAIIPALAVAIAGFVQHKRIRVPLIGLGASHLSPAYWPVEALPHLRTAVTADPSHPNVFNDLLFGGYIVYAAPAAKIYIDDRCELFGDDGLKSYMAAQNEPARLAGDLQRYDVRIALVRSGSTFDKYFSTQDSWSIRHRDATATLFTRN